ncbi:GSCOCT00002626001.3-RA-CDS [Cotesia congregata]|uniref:Odorant receptor n=1 Tax=Cotesia congregata TaxID=51543 RepID=A0A8J2HMZ3_COTCN|nr:GSCOCT00002626001.3-RA-CDS [Cotesia congregata]CAG5101726.1 olfactory receptor 45 [Cotesia congregata]
MENLSGDTHRKFLKIYFTVIRYSGMFALMPSAKIGWRVLNIFYKYLNFAILIFYQVTLGTDALRHVTNVTIFGNDGCFFFGVCNSLFKCWKFSVMQDKIIELAEEIYSPVDILLQSTDRGILVNIKSVLFWEQLQYYSCIMSNVFLTIALIFLVPYEKGSLPMRAVYPYDITVSPNHELTFFYQFYCVAYCLTVVITIDASVIGLMRWLTIQILALTNNYKYCNSKLSKRAGLVSPVKARKTFEGIDAMKIEYEDTEILEFLAFDRQKVKECDDDYIGRFKNCIKHHQRIKKLMKDFNDIFSDFLMMQFASSLLIICFNGFMMLIANSLSYSQWMSGWESTDERDNNGNKLSNLVTISMIPTLKPLGFKALGLFELSMPTFLSIVKSSYSTLILLTTVASD